MIACDSIITSLLLTKIVLFDLYGTDVAVGSGISVKIGPLVGAGATVPEGKTKTGKDATDKVICGEIKTLSITSPELPSMITAIWVCMISFAGMSVAGGTCSTIFP